ncbi:glycosyl transferase family 2 [Ruminococcaceae bacterium R-25]|nr:glycosyl transferase family 2 [Ruminococcaceae bacterium R-25]SUQ11328.1 Glycosyl transferase family 2 [Oscillospiraceae bacterium]
MENPRIDNEYEITVSVLCLAYNHEKYIRDALEGFVKQKTSFKYEVIVHDDASTDNTANIIREYQNEYPDIIKPIFQTENQYSKHVIISSTFFLPVAKGKYLAFCEGDDYWCDENKLQSQVDYLEHNKSFVACVHNTEYLYVESGKKAVPFPFHNRVLSLEDCVLRGTRSYHTSSLMVRKTVYENPPDFVRAVKGVGDYPKSIYYSLCGPIYYIGKVMSVYRFGTEGSWTKRITRDTSKYINNLESVKTMLKMADDYSNREHHLLFLEAIEQQDYSINVAKNDFKKVLNNKKFFSKESRITKIKYYIYFLFPFVRTIGCKVKKIICK